MSRSEDSFSIDGPEREYYSNQAFHDDNDEVVFDRNAVISVQPFSGSPHLFIRAFNRTFDKCGQQMLALCVKQRASGSKKMTCLAGSYRERCSARLCELRISYVGTPDMRVAKLCGKCTGFTYIVRKDGELMTIDCVTVHLLDGQLGMFTGETIRAPFPISTISGNDFRHSHVLPINGLALLYDVQEISIEQTIELSDLVSVLESENRFIIKTDRQMLYGAHEQSSATQRMFCGTNRSFVLRLFDRTRQEALFMSRRLACSMPLVGCYLQRMDVFEPPCTYLGCVLQRWTWKGSLFTVKDMNNYEVYTIRGPSAGPCCCHYSDTTFTVADVASNVVTRIEHQWDPQIMNFKLTVRFPYGIGVRERALLLASGLLLEYMFFQSSKSNTLCCFTCHK